MRHAADHGTLTASVQPPLSPRRTWKRLTRSPVHLALIWSLGYALLALWWTLGGAGFPFGRGYDPDPDYTNLSALTPADAGPIIAIWAGIAALGAWTLARPSASRPVSLAAVAFSYATAVALIFVVPDLRVFIRIAYLPVVIIGARTAYSARGERTRNRPGGMIGRAGCSDRHTDAGPGLPEPAPSSWVLSQPGDAPASGGRSGGRGGALRQRLPPPRGAAPSAQR